MELSAISLDKINVALSILQFHWKYDKLTDRQTDRHTDTQTHRHTDTHTHTQTHSQQNYDIKFTCVGSAAVAKPVNNNLAKPSTRSALPAPSSACLAAMLSTICQAHSSSDGTIGTMDMGAGVGGGAVTHRRRCSLLELPRRRRRPLLPPVPSQTGAPPPQTQHTIGAVSPPAPTSSKVSSSQPLPYPPSDVQRFSDA